MSAISSSPERLCHGSAEDPVEIGANDLVLARCGREHAHPLGLAPRFLSDFLREVRLVDLLERVDRFLLAGIGLAELGLDRPQLLAEIELALVLLDLDLGLPLDVLHHPCAGDFALEAREDEAQPLPDIESLQDLVLVGDAEVHVGRRQVGKPARVGHVHLEDCRHLVRDAVDEVGQCLRRRGDASDELLDLFRVGDRLLGGLDCGDDEGLGLSDLLDHDATQSLQRDLDGVARQVDALVHAGRDADASNELLGVDGFVVVAAGDDERHDQARFLVGAEEREVLRRPHLHGDGAQRIDDRRPQRHEWQRGRQFGLEDLFFPLRSWHGGR